MHLGEADPQILPPLKARIEALAETSVRLVVGMQPMDERRAAPAAAALWADGPLVAAHLEAARPLPRVLLPFDHAAAVARGLLRRRAIGASLARCRILSPSEQALRTLRREVRASLEAEVTGPLQAAPALPYCDTARYARVAAAVAGRPVWFAPAVPPRRLRDVLAVQAELSKRFHRLLLVLETADSTDWEPADPPTDRDSVIRARSPEEYGLWYRVAPVTVMGDSFDPGGVADPLEAAALGSAVVHGGAHGFRAAGYARLDRAGAARRVDGPEGLLDAVEALLAPDRAARLAQAAWAEVTRGAMATDRAAEVIVDLLDAAGAL